MDQASEQPRGRDAVRAAIISAARRRFAAEGLNASLRDIAGDAGVNLGLVHRHFGSKAALVRAVLSEVAGGGAARFTRAESFEEAIDVLVDAAVSRDEGYEAYTRMMAWMLLAGDDPRQFQDEYPAMDRVVELAGADRRADVLLVLAATFGWQIFAQHLAAMVGFPSEEAAGVAMAEALNQVVASRMSSPVEGRRPSVRPPK